MSPREPRIQIPDHVAADAIESCIKYRTMAENDLEQAQSDEEKKSLQKQIEELNNTIARVRRLTMRLV